MDYQDNYYFTDDEEEIDVEAIKRQLQIVQIGTWNFIPCALIISNYHAVPLLRGICDSSELIGKIPGKIEIFKTKLFLVVLSQEKKIENSGFLAASIWEALGQISEKVIFLDCVYGQETAVAVSSESKGGSLSSEISALAKSAKIPCEIHSLTYQGFRPSISGLLELSNSLPRSLEISSLSVEEMRKAVTKHSVFDEAAALYL